jgi:hypothetical protein
MHDGNMVGKTWPGMRPGAAAEGLQGLTDKALAKS